MTKAILHVCLLCKSTFGNKFICVYVYMDLSVPVKSIMACLIISKLNIHIPVYMTNVSLIVVSYWDLGN